MKLAGFISQFTGYSFALAFTCKLAGCFIAVFIIYLTGAIIIGPQSEILDFYSKWTKYAIILPFLIHFLQTGIFTKLGLPAFDKNYRLLNNFVQKKILDEEEYNRLAKVFKNIPVFAILNSFIYFGAVGFILILIVNLQYRVFETIDLAAMEILNNHILLATIVVIALQSAAAYFLSIGFIKNQKTMLEKYFIKNTENIVIEKNKNKFGVSLKFSLLIVFIAIACLYSFAVLINEQYSLLTAVITSGVFFVLIFLFIIKIYYSIKNSLETVNLMSYQLSQNGDAEFKKSTTDYEFESLQYNTIGASRFFNRVIMSFENRISELEEKHQEDLKSQEEDFGSVKKELEEVILLNNEFLEKEDISKIIKNALYLSETGNLDEAIKILEEAKNKYLQKPDIIFNLAKCVFQKKQYDYADELLAAYIEIDGEDKNAFYLAGAVKYKKNDFEESLSFIEKALALDSEFADAMLVQGVIYKKMGNSEKAESIFQRITQIDAENKMALFQLDVLGKTK